MLRKALLGEYRSAISQLRRAAGRLAAFRVFAPRLPRCAFPPRAGARLLPWRSRYSVTIARSSRYRLGETPSTRAVTAGEGWGVVITARGRNAMATLYAARDFRVNALGRIQSLSSRAGRGRSARPGSHDWA